MKRSCVKGKSKALQGELDVEMLAWCGLDVVCW